MARWGITQRGDYLLLAMAAAGALIHLGTAALRLPMFLPYPQMMDYGAFYAGAYALARGDSPYALAPELLDALRQERGLAFPPPEFVYPPIWGAMLRPFTWLPYAAAAVLWLLMLLVVLLWCAQALAALAGRRGWRATGLVWVAVLTFGPTFLALTLGQSSPLLLAATLLIGRTLSRDEVHREVGASLALLLAVASKLTPVGWLGALLFLRRWRFLVVALLAVAVLGVALGWLLFPAASEAFWLELLPDRLARYTGSAGLDDQSLVAWLMRIGQPQAYDVTGLSVTERHDVSWSPGQGLPTGVIRAVGYGALAVLGCLCAWALLQAERPQHEAAFYLWVLYVLLLAPHTERYNHVLLLPAMAWLWGQGERRVPIVAYLLAALSRLTHLWVLILPGAWAGLASGFGPLAALVLLGGVMRRLRPVFAQRLRCGKAGANTRREYSP